MDNTFITYTIRTLKICLPLVLVLLFIRTFIIDVGRVNGQSMEATLQDQEFLIINKIDTLLQSPQRGDVVQIVNADKRELIVKRVVGLPGETITISGQFTYINQERLTESYLTDPDYITPSASKSWTLQANEYFLLGDNRNQSIDSRSYGPVQRRFITGQVIAPFRKKI